MPGFTKLMAMTCVMLYYANAAFAAVSCVAYPWHAENITRRQRRRYRSFFSVSTMPLFLLCSFEVQPKAEG
jgi:hypothetical protein